VTAGPALAAGHARALRILFLAPQPFFEVRGTPLAVLAMVRALSADGHHVELLTFPQGTEVEVAGLVHRRSARLPVGRVKPGPSMGKLLLDVPFLGEAIWRMARGGFDVVHAVEEAAHLVAPFARLLRVPLVVDVDSSIPDQLRESGFARRGPLPWAAGLLERHALRHAAAVITVCTSLTEGVRARAPGASVFQVEDAPLSDAGTASAEEVAALRKSLRLDARPVVLYSGNFEPYQGVDLLVDAAAGVPDAQFVFMGGEPAEVEAMRARAAAIGLGERVVFTGKRPPSELSAFLGLADALVSPRRRGVNTPFKVYTYMASGRPLVATRILTHTQVLDDGNAWLVEPTPEALAAGLRAALSDVPEAARRAARARALVDREYSPARYAAKVRAAYAEVARSVTARRPTAGDILPR
jgi:glycosyltransferase involved in cell wall biosynthesis